MVSLLSMVFIISCKKPPSIYNEIKQPNPNIHFSDVERQTKLVNLLKQNNIPYTVEQFDKDGNDYIAWESQYSKMVRTLIKDIYEENGEQLPSNISFITEEQNKYFISLLEENGISCKVVKKTINGKKETNIEYVSEDEDKIRSLKIKVLKEKPINIPR